MGDVYIPPDQLLVLMTVDIGESSADEIRIHEGDEPEDLAKEFVKRNGLDPDNVIGDGPYGPVTLLPTLIEHVRQNKATARERMVKAMQDGGSVAVEGAPAPADGGAAPPTPGEFDESGEFDDNDDVDFASDDLPLDEFDSPIAAAKPPGTDFLDDPEPQGGSFLDAEEPTGDSFAGQPQPAGGHQPGFLDETPTEDRFEPAADDSSFLDEPGRGADEFGYDPYAGGDDGYTPHPDDADGYTPHPADGSGYDPHPVDADGYAPHPEDGYDNASQQGEYDEFDDDRPPSPTSTVSSRVILGTEDEREREYEALRRSFAGGMGARGGRARGHKAAPRRQASRRQAPRRAVATPRSRANVPRVANIRHRTSTPPAPAVAAPKRRSPTADEAPVFNRLYREAELREERRKRERVEQLEAERAKFTQFKDPEMGGAGYLEPTPRDGPGSPRVAKGVRLYRAGLLAMEKRAADHAQKRRQLEEAEDWVCPICAAINLGTSKTCTNVVKTGKVVMVRRAGPQSGLRPADPTSGLRPMSQPTSPSGTAIDDDDDSTQMLDEFGNVSARRHAPPRALSSSAEVPTTKAMPSGGEPLPPQTVHLCGTPKPVLFKPTISSGANEIRYNKDHLVAFKERRETWAAQKKAMEDEIREKELKECTFRPRINLQSAAIINEKRQATAEVHGSRVAVSNPHDRLYAAALKSQKDQKHREANANDHENLSFTPQVNRRSRPRTVDAAASSKAYDRLYKEKDRKASRLKDLVRKSESVDWKTGEQLFVPKTGRAPSKARNTHGLPIGEYLFRSRHHADDLLQKLTEQHMEDVKAKSTQRHTTSKSDSMVESLRFRAFGRIFRRLQRSATLSEAAKSAIAQRQMELTGRAPRAPIGPPSPDKARLPRSRSSSLAGSRYAADLSLESLAMDDSYGLPSDDEFDPAAFESDDSMDDAPRQDPIGTVCRSDVWTGVLHPDVEAVVLPVFDAAGERAVDFEEFSSLLVESVEKSGPGPRVYLLTKRSHLDKVRKEMEAQRLAECHHHPQVAPGSQRLFDNMVTEFGRTVPVHERLYHRKDAYDAHKKSLKDQFAKAELKGCTFKPKLTKTKVDGSRTYAIDDEAFAALAVQAEEEPDAPTVRGGGRVGKSAAMRGGRKRGTGRRRRGGQRRTVSGGRPSSPEITSPPLSAARGLGGTGTWVDGDVADAMADVPSRFESSPAFAGVSATASLSPKPGRSASPDDEAQPPPALPPAAMPAKVSVSVAAVAAAPAAVPVAAPPAPVVPAPAPAPEPQPAAAPVSNAAKKASIEGRIRKLLNR